MKNLTRTIMLAIALALNLQVQAQQWSDVGDPGFTVNPMQGVAETFPYAMNMTTSNGVPHVLYNLVDGQLTVMKYVGGVWTAIASPNTGPNAPSVLPQIASDALGNIFIAYKNNLSVSGFPAIITVKKFNGTSWSTVGTGGFTSGIAYGLAVDPLTNNPLVVTRDPGSGKASVYKFNGTNWAALGATDFTNASGLMRIAISSTGTPYVVYEDGVNSTKFSVKKFDGTNWVFVGSALFGETGVLADLTLDIAIDATGAPHVISKNVTSGKATVLKFNGTTWVTVGQAEFTAGTFFHARLEFSSAGVLHMVFQDGALASRASVMKFNGTSWVAAGNLGFSGGTARFPEIAFGTSDVPYVIYRDALQSGGDKGSVLKLCSSNTSTVGSSTPASRCGSGVVTLSATSATGTLRWYNNISNGAFVGTGTSFTTPSLSTTTTYSVAAYDANGCSSPRTAVVATVNAIPTITASAPNSRCGAGTVSLSATPSVGVINWFVASTGGSSVGSGTSFTTPSISTTTTYHAEANNNGCLSTSRTAVVATINEIPTVGGGIGSFRCGPGTQSIVAVAFPTGATLNWFTASTGGSSIGSGSPFITPSISVTTIYHAEASLNGCVSTSRLPINAEIRNIPTVTSTTPGERCGDGTVSLNSATSSGSQARWYDVATGGTALGTAKAFTTPIINNSITYYVEALENGCPSVARTAVIATIKPLPTLFISDVSRCDAGTVSFEAASTGVVSWFAASTGGSSLGTGPIYTTPTISVTTPYFAESTLNGCTTPARTQVQAIVINTPAKPTITQNNANIEVPVLTSSASADNQWYKDGSLIGGAINTTYTITDAGEYTVQVNNGCLSPFSDPVLYIITGFEVADERMLNIYPNPVAEELTISLKNFDVDRLVQVNVVDLLGRKMSQSTSMGGEEVKLNVRGYQSGQYLVLAQQGARKIIKQFIKSK